MKMMRTWPVLAALWCPLAFSQSLRPNYVACDSPDDLTEYTAAVAAKNQKVLARLWYSTCGSTTPLAGIAKVRVLERGRFMVKVELKAAGETIEVWTYPEALTR